MKIINGNLVKTIVQFGKDVLNVDLDEAEVSSVIKSLSFSENIALADALADDDADKILDMFDIETSDDVTNEAGYGTAGTQQQAISSIKAMGAKDATANRRATISQQDANRDAAVPQRAVAGGNKAATGQGASRYDKRADPDDVQRAQNAQVAGTAAQQAQQNAAEIERLKQLAFGRR